MAQVLILGYGNPLRGDDGVGWHAARRLAETFGSSEVEVIAGHQLTPELAEPLSRARLAVFIDAACDHGVGEVVLQHIVPQTSSSEPFSHQLTPEVLLGMAKRLYGACPEAVLLSVGAGSFELGQTLSPAVEAALPELFRRVQTVCGTAAAGHSYES
jgi:hydrogenase maturation protease